MTHHGCSLTYRSKVGKSIHQKHKHFYQYKRNLDTLLVNITMKIEQMYILFPIAI